MSVLLVIERSKAGALLSAMLWTTGDDDPRLLESRKFRGEGALKVWLAGIVTRYGRSNIRVNCPESLEGDDKLTVLLEESVGPIGPSVRPSET
ncbi:MAG TPA: hypothetical protein VFT38_12515 [Vicinamibacteria bacterium]|nr:hypothetical protein [Vicinamibacteria bacterium]